MVTDDRPNAAAVMQSSPPPGSWVPIPNGAHFIEIRNDGASGERYALFYELSL
jgi:hypothetical protein